MPSTAITRRAFLGGSAATAAMALSGCATNPVTGRRQFMLVSRADEISIDHNHSPHQISFDYGSLQDNQINQYISSVGNALTAVSHRPNMPYSFRGVNAVYVNAYAFPGGTIAVTRGLLLEMNTEAQLAALLGHEIGHVTARHSAAAMSTAMAAQMGLALAGIAAGIYKEDYADLAMGLGGVGAFLFLAKYSRDNEREADKLAFNYMTGANYAPEGLVDLMDILRGLNRRQPGAIEVMLSTHPMSNERYRDAQRRAGRDAYANGTAVSGRERYMDYTARLRNMADAIRALQDGEQAMVSNNLSKAETLFAAALKAAPEDYAALLLTAKCRIAQKRFANAVSYASAAKSVYPLEPQAWHVSGMANLRARRYDAALNDFTRYEQLLQGNPNTVFYLGYTREQMQRFKEAAAEYRRYLRMAPNGEHAAYTRKRLQEWEQQT